MADEAVADSRSEISSCFTCGEKGAERPEGWNPDPEEETNEEPSLVDVIIKPILADLFPKGFAGRPWEILKEKDFQVPFCSECAVEIKGIIAAKAEVENLKRNIEVNVGSLRAKTITVFKKDEWDSEESEILCRCMLGLTQKSKPRECSPSGVVEVVIKEERSATTRGKRKATAAPAILRSARVRVARIPAKSLESKTALEKYTQRKIQNPSPSPSKSPAKDVKPSRRPIKKPERYRDGETDVPDERGDAADANTLNDHSDLIALLQGDDMDDSPDYLGDAAKETTAKAEGEETKKKKKKTKSENTEARKRGRPRTRVQKELKERKQIQGPKHFSQEIEPGVYKYKDHTFRRREDEKWECDTCHTVLKGKHHTLVHISNIHLGTGKGEFTCTICGKSYERHSTMTLHMATHQAKTHMCQICGKLFTLKGNLTQHMLIHDGELTHVCPIETCGRKFLMPKQLRVHLRRHQGDKPYMCDQCSKRFLGPKELENHMRMHTGERPFGCHLCASKFFMKSRLSRHLRKVHKVTRDGNEQIYQQTVPLPFVVVEL